MCADVLTIYFVLLNYYYYIRGKGRECIGLTRLGLVDWLVCLLIYIFFLMIMLLFSRGFMHRATDIIWL